MTTTQTTNTVSPLCALTFDDGPHIRLTPIVLDILEHYGINATFFVVGSKIDDSTQPLLKRMVAMGCEIENHSWSEEGMKFMSPEDIKKSISQTNEAITACTGKPPAFFRPPNLAVSATLYENVGLPFAGGILAMDWDACHTTTEQRAQNVLEKVRDGAIILLHDVQSEPHPVAETLEILIPALISKGYRFATLSGLFKNRGITADPFAKKLWKYIP